VFCTSRAPHLVVGFSCLAFIALGLIVLPYPGIQNDEALFAEPLYSPYLWLAKIRIFHLTIPTMIMSYLGTLKAGIYFPLFRIWAPTVMSIRLPVLLAGTATIWLSFLVMCRISGQRAAVIAAVLLTTDVTFLMTTCFDWGPVALQHLLLVSGVLLLLKFHQDGGEWALCSGFLLFGLGLWDKALFVWSLAGLGAAAGLVFPGELARHLRVRNVVLAVTFLTVGAFPLLVYNLKSPANTVTARVVLAPQGARQKAWELKNTLSGSALLGYMISEDWMDQPRLPKTSLERFFLWVRGRSGIHRENLTVPALMLAIALVPWLCHTPARRPLLFMLLFLLVTWVEMALTAGAGGAVHHIALLWPFPFFFLATAFDEAARRMRHFEALAVALSVLSIGGANLLVYNQHMAQLIRDGGNGSWTDAIFPLSNRLNRYGKSRIYIVDWGMFNSLRLLNRGELNLSEIWYFLNRPEPDERGKREIQSGISNPEHIFVNHIAKLEVLQGIGEHLTKWAREAGYERVYLETICDGNGRPVFEIFRFRAAAPSGSRYQGSG
jgi:hypothetical protein